jgi:hypothetical protein
MGCLGTEGAGSDAFMSLLRQGLVWIVCFAVTITLARANDLTVAQPQPPRTSAAKIKPLKPHKLAPSPADGLGGVKFSNPYAPPEGTTQAKTVAFPIAPRPVLTEPKGGLSITAGMAGPDDPMTGGLKFGF